MREALVRTCLVGAVAALGVLIPGAALASSTDHAHWTFDEVDSATAFDSTSYGNDGINHNIVGDGGGYTFNGTSSRVVVADHESLNPGAADFSFGVTLEMAQAPALNESYDMLRKGLAGQKGGHYKLEIVRSRDKALARCVVQDTNRVSATVRHNTDLADGRPHDVSCVRVGNNVSVQVDALAPRTKTVTSLGSVGNTADLGLGAKAEATAKTGFDWYLGRLLDGWVRVG